MVVCFGVLIVWLSFSLLTFRLVCGDWLGLMLWWGWWFWRYGDWCWLVFWWTVLVRVVVIWLCCLGLLDCWCVCFS